MRPGALGAFSTALKPLQVAGKLGAIVFQFPQWFIPSRDGYAHILTCVEKLEGIPVAVEFRNRLWLKGIGASGY